MRFPGLLFFSLVAGCFGAFTTDESTDTTTGALDAGPRTRDGGPRPVDFGSRPDRPPIATESPLRDALTCGLGEERAQRAILVHVACVDDGSTVSGLIEAWHAGLLGTFQQGVDGWTGFPLGQGCGYWRCLSATTSCAERDECFAGTRSPASCEPGERSC
ncbi:MAG: hypothetical protein GWN07_13735, partial [Actinobacteria bacterium]|nr:hypothetical protein [Actinomycetota bacterium]NIS31404.1 hypothetical protein [Actinomycetota bacterium]NIU66519.1 hypothetical protein [Actinomycetota bacterium]NIW28331.1 hypothetical protein [Actinomycetota bacterium]NIX20830.1 hypothetical protein [Actinomycetota bacterium]